MMENANVKFIYSNAVSVSNSLFETRLEFSVETPNSNGEKDKEVMVDIRVSPQLAKKIRDILTQSIEAYESKIGVIPSNDNISEE